MSIELNYLFTKDPDLLAPYYMIREQCYKEVWGLKIFSGAEDEHDRKGHILIVRDGEKVIGGGRLYLRSTDSSDRLPLETDGFLLHEILPELKKNNIILGDIGRIAVLPEYRGKKVSTVGLYLCALAQSLNCDYVATVAPLEQAKKYLKIAKQLNMEIISTDTIEIENRPYYNQLTMKLLVCNLKKIPNLKQFLPNQTINYFD